MSYNKIGDMFKESLSKQNFSTRTTVELDRFVSKLNGAKDKKTFDEIVDSTSVLKNLLKKEGIQNSEFNKIINNISKKL